jgi:glucosamine 6-phosphate synthetase-like amidotransferase/phosphosugar isomerase protein
MIWAPQRRSRREIDRLVDTFTRLLLYSEHRGPQATGVAWLHTDGTCQVEKAPLPARAFVGTLRYAAWVEGIEAQTTLLLGHTRWPTRGAVGNPANNHPLVAPGPDGRGHLLLTHNGHLVGVDRLFARYHLPREAQVDSEFLIQLASRHWAPEGLDLPRYLHDLQEIEGRMSAVLVATSQPETIYLLKGNQPLEVVYHPRDRVLCYASAASILRRALSTPQEWDAIPVQAGQVLVVTPRTLPDILHLPFAFQGLQHDSESAMDLV